MKHGLAGIILCGFLACGEGKLATIEFSETAEATVPSAGTLGTITELVGNLGFSGFTDMNISESEELANQGVAPGDINEAFITNFSLEALSPEGSDLSFLDSLEIWVEAEGLEPVLVASQDEFPEGVGKVDFIVEDVDITEYVVSEAMTITTEASGSLPSEETQLEAEIGFSVGITAQGACNAMSQE